MRTELSFPRKLRRVLVAAAIIGPLALAPAASSAEGLFDFFFGGGQKQQHQAAPQASFFSDPFNNNPQAATPPRPAVASSGPAFCVRSCDGRYFPLMRGGASPKWLNPNQAAPASPSAITPTARCFLLSICNRWVNSVGMGSGQVGADSGRSGVTATLIVRI